MYWSRSARYLEEAPGLVRGPARARPAAPRLHRRARPVDQNDPLARPRPTREALPGRCSARTVEDRDLGRWALSRGHHRAFVNGGAMDGTVFLANVEQVLVPMLKQGDVVVRDSTAQKPAGVREAIERVGATFPPLPPRSLRFQPRRERLRQAHGRPEQGPSAQSPRSRMLSDRQPRLSTECQPVAALIPMSGQPRAANSSAIRSRYFP